MKYSIFGKIQLYPCAYYIFHTNYNYHILIESNHVTLIVSVMTDLS